MESDFNNLCYSQLKDFSQKKINSMLDFGNFWENRLKDPLKFKEFSYYSWELKKIIKSYKNNFQNEGEILGKSYLQIYLGPDLEDENSTIYWVGQIQQLKENKIDLNKIKRDKFENLKFILQMSFKMLRLVLLEKHQIPLIYIDDLEGAFNQRKLLKDLNGLVEEGHEFKNFFSLYFIDVDNFKEINEIYGHVVGSQILRELGRTFKKILPSDHKVYRYGGDEFVVVFPRNTHQQPDEINESAFKLAEEIKKHPFGQNEQITISLSIGIAHFPFDGSTTVDLINLADKMMYLVKNRSRGDLRKKIIGRIGHVETF
jgi:diguanylate cyclase (GGDEF)-like protein